jgi:hypothetical protein
MSSFIRLGSGGGGGGGGGSVPGGLSGDVQYNDSGTFGGSSNFTFDGMNVVVEGTLTAGGLISDTLLLNGSGSGTISILPQSAAGTYNFNLPTTAGTSGFALVSGGGGASPMTWVALTTGTVTSVSIASANGFAGSSSGGATPALTLSTTITGILQGNGTAISAASTTGSGAVVLATSPTLVTPALGTPSALVGTNITGTGSSFTAGNINATTNSTLTSLPSLTLPVTQLSGVLPIVTGGTNASTPNAAFNNLSPMTTAGDIIYEDNSLLADRLPIGSTGQVLTVVAGLPSWQPPATSGTVTAVSVVSANGFAGSSSGGATPALTLSTTITGILQGNGTAISAATTTGSGAVVLATSPTLVTPALGTPSAAVLTNATGLPLTSGVTGVLPIANGGTDNGSLPVTAGGVLYTDGTMVQNVGAGTSGQFLKSNGASAPSWINSSFTPVAPTQQIFTTPSNSFTFTLGTIMSATAGDTYQVIGYSDIYTVTNTVVASTTIVMSSSASALPPQVGVITVVSGSGTPTRAYQSYTVTPILGTYTLPTSPSPLYIQVEMVGGGGGGGDNDGSTAGVSGQSSTFGTSLLVANGGTGGSSNSTTQGGGGGTASLGSGPSGVALSGGSGNAGSSIADNAGGGMGGNTAFGGSGGGGISATAGGTPASAATQNTGAGGGGAGSATGGSGGGGGASGYVNAIIYTPSSTYSYNVGAGGTSGSNAGFGADGIIIVTEYYQ